MTVGRIFTKIGTFTENRQTFMLLNCNCSKLANFEIFKACMGGRVFVDTVYSKCKQVKYASLKPTNSGQSTAEILVGFTCSLSQV